MKKYYFLRITSSIIILLLGILIISGIFSGVFYDKLYSFNLFDTQFSGIFQRTLIDFSILSLIFLVIILGLTLIFGRFYCSILCPFGTLQEIISSIALKFKKKNVSKPINRGYKYLISALCFGALIGGSAIILRYIDPYTLFGSFITFSAFGIIAFSVIFILTLFKRRYFCTNICPVGAILGLLSKVSLFKIYIDKEKCISCSICQKNCPSFAINCEEKTVDNEICVKCLKCTSLCKKEAVKYGLKPKEKVKFNLKRREALFCMGALSLLAVGYISGMKLLKETGIKVKNIILPAGAADTNRMLNKCLNCNLCIQNCPNKILSKANNEFGAVHIDYKKGKGYCEYDCIECSKICPTGAIKRISKEDKQRTRIAMASIDNKNCQKCGICILSCPTKAIENNNGDIKINSEKCIGCGKCQKTCNFEAIKVYSITKQELI